MIATAPSRSTMMVSYVMPPLAPSVRGRKV
jgi:hypothetical protein